MKFFIQTSSHAINLTSKEANAFAPGGFSIYMLSMGQRPDLQKCPKKGVFTAESIYKGRQEGVNL